LNRSNELYAAVFWVDEVLLDDHGRIRQPLWRIQSETLSPNKVRLRNSLSPPKSPSWLDRIRDRLRHTPVDSARAIFLERAFDAVIDITQAVPLASLQQTAAANNNMLVLLKALQSPELLPELERYEPLASPYLKGIQAQQDLLREAGGLMSSLQVANLLRLSRQAVDKRRLANKLIAIPQGQHAFRYPACQFDDKGPLPGLEEVLSKLDTADAWMPLIFLLSPNATLGDQSPLQLLRLGETAQVLNAASSFGNHGAL
jgi:hypothetical protein